MVDIEATEDAIRSAGARLFTADSLALCEERMGACDRLHGFVPLLGMAMCGLRLRGGFWREDIIEDTKRKFSDHIAIAAVVWAVEALEERTDVQ